MRTERGRFRLTLFEVLIVLSMAVAMQALVAYARRANGAEPAVRNVRSCRVAVCGFGTAFSLGEVSPRHHVFVTAAHVVEMSSRVDVGIDGQWRPARVLRSDRRLDVAVLGVVHDTGAVEPVLLAERNAVDGQAVRWLGCPGAGPVREGKGRATGPGSFAPHPIGGDSGGPVLDAETGEVVGLVVTRGGSRANANVGGMVAVSDLRRIVYEACGGLPPVQDRPQIAPVPDPGLLPPPVPAPGPFAVDPAPRVPPLRSAPAPPSAPPAAMGAASSPASASPGSVADTARLAGDVAAAVAPKLVPALLPFLPEGLAALAVPAAVASGPVGLGILAGGALLRVLRRRRAGRGTPHRTGDALREAAESVVEEVEESLGPVVQSGGGLAEMVSKKKRTLSGPASTLRQLGSLVGATRN